MTRDPFISLLRGISWLWVSAYCLGAFAVVAISTNRGDFSPLGILVVLPVLALICAPALLILHFMDPAVAPVRRLDDLDTDLR